MIGTKYTLAELAKTPDGQWVSSFTKRYTDSWGCKTTADCSADDSRFGFTLDHDVEKVMVFLNPEWGGMSFISRRRFEEGLDERSVALSTKASVELRSEVSAVSAIEVTRTDADKITSFFEDEASEEPWLVIVEPD